MRHEAAGRLDEAQAVYDSILQEDETNMVSTYKKKKEIMQSILTSAPSSSSWHQSDKSPYSKQETRIKKWWKH
jgi:hypothetical protein